MIWRPLPSTAVASPNSAPGVPLVSSCTGSPTKPIAGEISKSRFGIGGLLMSPLLTIRSPSDNSAALIGALNCPPVAITRADTADGPEKVGTGLGVATGDGQFPTTTTPSWPIPVTLAKATTL